MRVSLSQARELVPPLLGVQRVVNADGITSDIVASVREVSAQTAGQTARLAAQLRGARQLETCRNVFDFVRHDGRSRDYGIRYVLDPAGQQLIKTPAAVVHTGFCDCKGYALLITSLLRDSNIRCALRFVSFGAAKVVTHVYAVAWPSELHGAPVVLDACLPRFNEEKPYTHKQDYDVTQIVHISGVDDDFPGVTPLNLRGDESVGELDLKLMRQRVQLEKHLAERAVGVSSPLVANLAEAERDYTRALNAVQAGPAAVAAVGAAISGKAKKKAASPAKSAPAKKRGGFIKKAAGALKKTAVKAVKTTAKVVTAPARLVTKGLLEVALPKAAPFFLYLFITNAQTVATLPAPVQRKRKKAEKFSRFVIKVIGMKEAHFMQIVRNGIMKKMGATPEQILAQRVQGPISGIGVVTDVIALVLELVGLIKKLFPGKAPAGDEMPTADDTPDLNTDFADASASALRQLAVHVQQKPASQKGQEPDTLANELRQEVVEQSAAALVRQEPEGTPVDAPLPTYEEAAEAADTGLTTTEETALEGDYAE